MAREFCNACNARANILGVIKHDNGCPNDTTTASTHGKRERATGGHVHKWKTTRTTTKEFSERVGLRRVKWRYTYEFQKCQNAGCPSPDNVEVTRQQLK